MPSPIRVATVGGLVLSILAMCASSRSASAAPAGPLPGAPDFQPTPENPVGWRGDGTGRYPGATPPLHWARKKTADGYSAEGVAWMTPLPNRSAASPIVVADRIYVTADFTDLVCLDKQTGRILWIRSNPEFDGLTDEERAADPAYVEKMKVLGPSLTKANSDVIEELNALRATAATSTFRPPSAALTNKRAIEKQIVELFVAFRKKRNEYALYGAQSVFGYSGMTPTSDGKNVCAYFATGVSACYDTEGNRKWIKNGKGMGAEHGNFASPLLCDNQLVVWANELRSYDVASGKLLWQHPFQSRNTYGSVFRLQSGKEWVACSQNGNFVRIRDGKVIWNTKYAFDDSVSTPIVEGNNIYAISGYDNVKAFKSYPIPPDTDAGKIAAAIPFETSWDDDFDKKDFRRDYVASPLFVDGLLYRLTQGGGLLVNEAATGKLVYRKVLPIKPRTAYWDWGGACTSPTLAGKYIYLMDNQGATLIIEPGREYKEVAANTFEDFGEHKSQVQNLATPVFEGSRMYYRSPGFLYCIGEK